MNTHNEIFLTPKDYAILEHMLEDFVGKNERLVSAIRRKLNTATVVFAQDLPADVVTIGSRVSFQISGNPVDERVLVSALRYKANGLNLSLGSLEGVELLGLREGARVEVDLEGQIESLNVLKLVFQPEASGGARIVAGAPLVSA